MRFFLLLVLISPLFFFPLKAQTSAIEELKQELRKSNQDTSRVRLLNELALQIRPSNIDSALIYAKDALNLSRQLEHKQSQIKSLFTISNLFNYHPNRKDSAILFAEQAKIMALEIGDKKKLAESLYFIGRGYSDNFERVIGLDYYNQSLQVAIEANAPIIQFKNLNGIGKIHMYAARREEAEKVFQQALEVAIKIKYKNWQAGILQNLGNNAVRGNRVNEAVDYYQQAILIFEEMGNDKAMALMFRLIGYTYIQAGYYPAALEYYQKALNIQESFEEELPAMETLTEMATIYESMEDYEKALSYRQKILEFYLGRANKVHQAGALNNIGNTFLLQEKYDTALEYFFKAFNTLKEFSGLNEKVNTFSFIGSVYEKINQLDSAATYLQAALSISRKMGDRLLQTSCLLSLGAVYKKQNQLGQAKSTLEEALTITKGIVSKNQEQEVRKLLYELYREQKDYQLALINFEAHQIIQDSLFNEKNTREISRLEAQNEFEKKKQQLEFEQEQKNAKQKSFQSAILSALGISILLILIIAWYYRQKQRSNKKLQELNEQLEDLGNIKSRFFTNISHELRTPLTVIGGMAEQILTAPNKWLNQGLKLIIRNNNNLLNLVNQILDLRKLESGNLKLDLIQADIVNYLQDIAHSFRSMAESKGLKLHFQSEMSTLLMDYDKEKILRVISNLLSNAIKFTAEGGVVYLKVESERSAQNLKIQVKDTGIGIPPEKVPHVFDRFYQADDSSTRKGEGTGIGLALTRELVRLMRGDITLESKAGVGSSFFIHLPITRNAIAESEATKVVLSASSALIPVPIEEVAPLLEPPIPDTADLPTLLIIEDNSDLVQYLSSFLETQFQISVANDGEEGIQKALELIPDLIVSDVMMPKKDGFEVCMTLKTDELTSHIPIVLLTAKADIESRIAGLERGADAYLGKPFNQKELVVRLEKLLELRQRLQKRYQSLEPVPPSNDIAIQQEDEFVLKLTGLIEAQMENEQFGVPDLCQAIGMSRSQLHRKIKALSGHPTSHLIRAVRLKKAKTLIHTTNLNISEIAYEVGFRDPSYFSRVFVEVYGQKPSEVRK